MTDTANAWTPLGDQILVRPLIEADRTTSGLYKPQQALEKPQSGLVLAIGPGTPESGPVTAVGIFDLVAFGNYAGVTFTLDTGEDVLLMRATELLARKRVGLYDLVVHTVKVGLADRSVAHEAGARCEHCPAEPKSAVIAEERARFVASQHAPIDEEADADVRR